MDLLKKDSDLKIEDAVYDEVLNAGLGWMHELKKRSDIQNT